MPFDEFGWIAPEVTPEILSGIARAREAERRVREALGPLGEDGRAALVRSLVVGDAAVACDPPLDMALPTDALCEACLEVRGPFAEGLRRRVLRERARLHLRLSQDAGGGEPAAPALRSADDMLALWDEATRREPDVRLRAAEPRWRTEADGEPFTGQFLASIRGPRPLVPGQETAAPADIPSLAQVIVNFAQRDDLPPEVVALGMLYLLFRIHPFTDGNGHVMRMLACDILHRAGYSEPTLLAFPGALRARRKEHFRLSIDVAQGRASTTDHVAFLLEPLLQAQETVPLQTQEAVPLQAGLG